MPHDTELFTYHGRKPSEKDALLDKITDVCERQEVLLKEDSFSLEEFDKLMETKGKLAEELNRLDDGFESLYEK